MTTVTVVYASTWGNTERMARAFAGGAEGAGATVVVRSAEEATADEVAATDALALASPNRHHGVDSRVRGFCERVLEPLWVADALVGKVGAAIGNGGGYGDAGGGGDVLMLGLVAPLAWSGMVIVPLPKTTPGFGAGGTAWGPKSRTGAADMVPVGVDDEHLLLAGHHGANVARVAAQLSSAPEPLFATGNVAPPAWLAAQWLGRAPAVDEAPADR